MISTTSAIHHILAFGGVDSSIIIGGSDTKSTLDRRLATTTNDDTIAMEDEDDTQQQQPTCYICYETNDTNNHPTQRYCACRGTSGYVHTSCLLNYTKQQMIIQQQYNNNHHSIKKLKPSTLLYCSICKNRYNQPLYTKLRNVILDSITKKSKSDRGYGRLINLHTLISVGLSIVYIFDILSILDVITFDESNIVPMFNNLPSIMPTLHITQNLLLLTLDILLFLLLTSQVSINTKQYTYCYITFLISRSLFSYKIGLYHGIETAELDEGGEMDVWSRMGCSIFKLVYDSNVMSVDERLLLGCADQL